VGLHTCTAVARSLCVSWAFLYILSNILLAPVVWQCRRSLDNSVTDRTWNDLPDDVTSAESLSTFHQWPVCQILFLIIPWTGLHLTSLSSGPGSRSYYLSHFRNPRLIDWSIVWCIALARPWLILVRDPGARFTQDLRIILRQFSHVRSVILRQRSDSQKTYDIS